MQQGTMTRGGRSAQGMGRVGMLLALLIGFVAGALSLAAYERASVAQPVVPATLPQPVAPQPAVESVPEEGALSPREAAQFRAFYAQQMASEAALERWSLPAAAVPTLSPAQRAFYAQQMASEAALERWAAPAQLPDRAPGSPRAPRVAEGAQFE